MPTSRQVDYPAWGEAVFVAARAAGFRVLVAWACGTAATDRRGAGQHMISTRALTDGPASA